MKIGRLSWGPLEWLAFDAITAMGGDNGGCLEFDLSEPLSEVVRVVQCTNRRSLLKIHIDGRASRKEFVLAGVQHTKNEQGRFESTLIFAPYNPVGILNEDGSITPVCIYPEA